MNQEKCKNRNKKRGKNTRIKKGETPTPREAYDHTKQYKKVSKILDELNKHMNKSIKYPVWTCEFRVIRKRHNERVNKGKSIRAYNV